MERYLKRLIHKHRALDKPIREESRPATGWSPRLRHLKRLRRALKDQIAALQRARSGQSA